MVRKMGKEEERERKRERKGERGYLLGYDLQSQRARIYVVSS